MTYWISEISYWLAVASLISGVVAAMHEGVSTWKPNSGWTWIAVAFVLIHLSMK